jgi:hypothetical protein
VGASFGIGASFADGAELGPFVNFEGGLRAGLTVNDSTHQGVSVGVQLPLVSVLLSDESNAGTFGFLEFVNIDGYVTGPQLGELETSFGVTASNYHFMPYLQVGHYEDWFATLAVSVPSDEAGVIIGLIGPSYTSLRRKAPTWVTQSTYTAALRMGEGETIFMAGISLIFEFHRKNARSGS